MSWFPNDLVTDKDLLAYEQTILTQFNVTDWQEKRRKALEDWMGPILKSQGFDLERFRTRYEADSVQGYTASAYTDVTSAAKSGTGDDLNLAAIFTSVGVDALYIGSTAPFRGISVRMLAGVSIQPSILTVTYWNDGWTALGINDQTRKLQGRTFSGGGSVTWQTPADWVKRAVNGSLPYYFVKMTVSATPTAATAGQIGVIRRSNLCAPATLRTLMLVMLEAPSGGEGPWREKALRYESEADAALQRALQIIGGEFETDDPQTDQLSETEAAQTVSEVSHAPFRMERA